MANEKKEEIKFEELFMTFLKSIKKVYLYMTYNVCI